MSVTICIEQSQKSRRINEISRVKLLGLGLITDRWQTVKHTKMKHHKIRYTSEIRFRRLGCNFNRVWSINQNNINVLDRERG